MDIFDVVNGLVVSKKDISCSKGRPIDVWVLGVIIYHWVPENISGFIEVDE